MIYPDKMVSRVLRGLLRVAVTLAVTAGIIVAGSAAKVELRPLPDETSVVGGAVR